MVSFPPALRRLRRRHLLLCCLAALLCGPVPGAHAGEVHVNDCCASFVAADNESNHIWIEQVQNGTDNWTASFYQNRGDAGIAAGDGCTVTFPSWSCQSISAVVGADLKDGDDSIGPLPGSTVPGVLDAFGGPGNDDLSYYSGYLDGGDGNDRLELTSVDALDDNLLWGRDGDDTFVGLQGHAKVHGGDGSDTLTFAGTPAAVTITLDDVADDGTPGEGADVYSDVENVVGSQGADLLVGNGAANALDGGEGGDELIGGSGPDALTGGNGDDVISAGDG
jgi:Ca2+-binding RTX toxin-like protein